MAQRGKRISRNDNDSASCPGAIKRRKCRVGPAATDTPVPVAALGPSEEEETMASSSQGGSSWTPRPLSDIKISSIYNRSAAEPPAELYRKDLISAMKLPDSEPLSPSEYWVISDQWKQEWEKGVQVPVNPDSLPEPTVTVIQTPPMSKLYGEFKLPKKFLRISRDEGFNPEDHYLSTTPARAEKACGYDLDDTDIAWLEVLNGERALCGQPSVTESQLERVIEELEHRCWDKIQTIVKNEEGLGIEYDENVICDVCRSPDSEEGNEMVFCDFCNICVHQACYGITSIPDGSWLCRTCSLGQRPECVLCPNPGGAMKSTRSGQKWAHVSCALWIPEVSIGCVERMEPITKISSIPQSRWALICVLCRERVGACIQCSIKTCKTAYHVTCAFKHGLEMKAIIEDEQAEDGVKLRSYCQKHGKINTKDKTSGGGAGSGSGKGGSDSDEGEVRRRKRKDMSSEEKNQARAAKLQEIEAEFDKHVSLKDITNQQLDVDSDAIVYIYNYWKLKRRSGHNKPLLPPRCGELSGSGVRAQGQAADNEKMRKFVQLRQDLERVRNLCYMVNRREKLCRTFLRLREQTFHKQVHLVSGSTLPAPTVAAVLEANHGPSIYDHLYSHPEAETHSHDIDSLLSRIKGLESPTTPLSSDEKKHQPDFNGASNKRLHFNGSVSRKKLYGSDLSSMSSSETDQPKPSKSSSSSKTHTDKKVQQLSKAKVTPKVETDSSTEDEDKQSIATSKASSSKVSPRRKPKKTSAPDRPRTSARKILDESSESDSKPETAATRSRTLQHMERELGSASGSDSDELIPISNKSAVARLGPTSVAEIYSDTDSSLDRASSNSTHIATKATVKSFAPKKKNKDKHKDKDKGKDKDKDIKDIKDIKDSKESLIDDDKKDASAKNKENQKALNKKRECIASALIVPQRQAAKKASENMQRSQSKKESSSTSTLPTVSEPSTDIKPPVEDIKPIVKQPKEYKESKSSSSSTTSISRKQKQENKSSSKETMKDAKGNDIYDFDKEFGDTSEIFAYVPQRQAAKKAAEHIKSGISSKSSAPPAESDTSDTKVKKETPEVVTLVTKKKQEIKKEESPVKEEAPVTPKKPVKKVSPSKLPSESSSSSSSSSSCSSSSDSSSDTDESKSPESSRRTSTTKERAMSTTTSSESDSGHHSSSRGKTTTKTRPSPSKPECKAENKTDAKVENKALEEDEKKSSSLSSSSGTGRKLKKLPDKKLKTSDGRHGHEFQPPSTERDEPSRASSVSHKDEHKDGKQHKEQQYQQSSGKHKPPEHKDSSAKKSASVQSQQHRHQQQHQSQAQADEGVLSGSRDNDGSRSLSGFKSSKKFSPVSKHSQQQQQQQQWRQQTSLTKGKEDVSTTPKGKVAETRKRKSSQVPQKEEKSSSKDASPIKKVEKKLSEKPNDKTTSKENVERDASSSRERIATVEPIQKITTPASESPSTKSDSSSKKSKKNNNKNTAVTLEEEMKQRRAERDSPKKSSRGLDKLLEKREHLDKLSRSKNAEISKAEKTQSTEKPARSDRSESPEMHKATISKITREKSEDRKSHTIDSKESCSRISNETAHKKDLADTPLAERLTEDNKKISEEKLDVPASNSEHIESLKQHQLQQQQYKDDVLNKGSSSENLFSKSVPDKLTAINEISEKENSNKRRRSINRSIFSPQHGGSKDTGVAELFDFDQDILTDDMVNDDGFSIPRDAEERAAPLSFSFNNELWFKEDTKEDSARETMNLVEKLRMELSKKSNSSQFELEPTIAAAAAAVSVEAEIKGLRSADAKLKIQVQQEKQNLDERSQAKTTASELSSADLKNSNNAMASHLSDGIRQSEAQGLEDKQKSCYANNSEQQDYLPYVNEDLESGKVAMAERAKLDRAEADERWVPPSIDNFNAEQLSALIDSHAHRYGLSGQQFPNDLSAAVLAAENANADGLVHSQLHVDMQEQYNIIRAATAVQQHIDSHGEQQARTVQGLASLVEQQVGSLPTHMVDEMTPMEMVNRQLIGLPSADDDQNDDRTMDKDEMGSEIARQDYAAGGSPYNDIAAVRQDTRWAESQVLPSRRSTSSSITSASSVDDHSGIPPYKSNSGSGLPPMSFPACSVEADVGSYHSYEPTNSYAGPVSLFPPQPSTAQLPYPSPGTAMFPPPFGAPFPTPQSLLTHVSKPLDEQLTMQASSCTAAFTSSSHNMAFTAAMVSPTKLPSPPPPQSALDEHEHQREDLYQRQLGQQQQELEQHQQPQQPPQPPPIEESPAAAVAAAFLNSVSESIITEPPVETVHEVVPNEQAKSAPTHAGKKSLAKPTRTSARVTSLQAKSPGKSPRQLEVTKPGSSSRGRGRGAKSSHQTSYRGRGRGRGRGRAKATQHNSSLHSDDSIQNKLVGTVYDFDSDEDSPSEANIADLRTMRERKKSIEFSAAIGSERRDSLATLANDSLASHLSSPSEQRHLHKSCGESKRLAMSSPSVPGDDSTMGAESESGACHGFNDTVMPLLPGPVDMRTYNSTIDAQGSSLHGQSYTNHLLGSFSAASADHSIPDVEEDLDKELRSALIAEQQPDLAGKGIPALDAASAALGGDPSKVSLMDSRNQLKVKIKGPFLDANYAAASTVSIPLAQQVNPIIPPTANSVGAVASGTSNLRRMRKKELLRQYCSQDMNMDDPASGSIASAPIVMPPISRTVITIPKAVASMTSIPTREDYKAVVDANMEKKRRKERASVGNLGSFVDQQPGIPDEQQQLVGSERRRSSSGATGSAERRRGRQPRPSTQPSAGTSSTPTGGGPPKLKIKISSSAVGQDASLQQEDRSNNRPPKKRICSIPNNMPSMEELRRDSMKFRRMIMEDFNNSSEKAGKIKKDKKDKDKDKNGRRKKSTKQSSKVMESHVQLLEDGAAPPKLIIRLGKSNQSSGETESAGDENGASTLSSGLAATTTALTTDTATTTTTSTKNSSTSGTTTSGSGSQESCEQARLAPPPSMGPEEEAGSGKSELSGATPQNSKQLPAQLEHSSVSALRNVRCAKVTPIRLKLTRCQEGYELKSPGTVAEQQQHKSTTQPGELAKEQSCKDKHKKEEEAPSSRGDEKLPVLGQSATATTPTAQHSSPSCPPAPLPQGCQVR